MNNNRIKKLSAFMLCIIIISLLTAVIPTHAVSYGALIDDAQLFSSQEEQEIQNAIMSVSGVRMYIITTRDSFFNENKLLSLIERDNSIVLTINMNTRHYDIHTYGQANANLFDSEIRKLESAVESKLSSDNYKGAVLSFIEKADIAYNGELKTEPIIVILWSLGISVVIAIIVCAIVIAKYKMKMRPTNYPLDKYAKMQLNQKEDVFLGKVVTTRRIQTSTSSGGGGRSSSGGGHRGGGSF